MTCQFFSCQNSDKFGTKLGSVDTSSMFATWEIYLARFFSWYKAWDRKFSHSKWLTHNAIAAKNMLVLLRSKQSSALFLLMWLKLSQIALWNLAIDPNYSWYKLDIKPPKSKSDFILHHPNCRFWSSTSIPSLPFLNENLSLNLIFLSNALF